MSSHNFYDSDTTDQLAQQMLGMLLTYESPNGLVGGRIVETEAYMGEQDSAAHAFQGKRTASNEPLYGPAGTVYIYSIHGKYLLDVATQGPDVPQGILIRAIEPTIGQEIMYRNRPRPGAELTNGPGKLMAALGIAEKTMNFEIIGEGKLNIDVHDRWQPRRVQKSGRIGVSIGEWTDRPLRYYVRHNPYVSGIKRNEVNIANFGWI
ncbi:DNA-3-methyladenine glycosylase [Lentilactobacillus sp. SPB1-3]|uniref:DNA-3-methyladenine glycosylase n=1 Tax=Lentilactobacillus terminaliae TaxID=3003483 RepID=A0ACD5DF13_9LACO|nr:DNA-3-methyladenine glycosylase [Lentilactobacillus sp. SPB1-3]MCZ0976521.1 DNA-3-methyladenine glycosylase [Lentilactobacillus sp. SPB1-3]